MRARNKVFLYKVESVKGTDAVPDVANDLIVLNGDINVDIPTDQDMGEGDLKGTFGPGDSVTVKQAMNLPGTTRVRGLGKGAAALLVPHEHAALMAAGHVVTQAGDGTTVARSADYKPTSLEANLKAATAYFYEDGLLYKLLGAQNDLKFSAQIGQALMMEFAVQAGYAAPTVVALPSWGQPSEEIFRMTSALCSVTDDAAAINIGAFTFDAGVTVEEDNSTGAHFFEIADRNPVITIDPRAVATVDDWTKLTNATSVALVATFTNGIGETLVFTANKAVPQEVKRGTRAGRITSEKTFSLKETAGDDQYSIKWTSVL